MMSGPKTSEGCATRWKLPSLTYSVLLNYMFLLLFVAVSYLMYSATVSAEKAISHVADNIVGNTSSGFAQGLGQRLASLFIRSLFHWGDSEPIAMGTVEELLPGVTLLW